jgi:hypothetical protein
MAQTQVQYTPVQVLQAARRAEAEGKMDYALQFYRHIVEHHGTTVEAQEAREGLFRIAEWRWGEARLARRQDGSSAPNGYNGSNGAHAAAQSAPQPGHHAASSPQPHPAHQPAPQAVPQKVHQSQPSHQAPFQGGAQRAAPGVNANAGKTAPQQAYQSPESAEQATPVTANVTQLPQIIAREAAAKAAEANREPEPYKVRYRGAKAVALLLSGCGWIGALGGLLMTAMGFADFAAEISAVAMLGLPLGVVLGVPAAIIGLVLVVTGYLAVAVFDSANATIESLRRKGAGY